MLVECFPNTALALAELDGDLAYRETVVDVEADSVEP
jgi:hypothetical protein